MATQLVRTFGAAATITCTLSGLAYTAGRETDVLTLSATAEDYAAIFKFTTTTGTHSGDAAIYVYACPSPDGTQYPIPAIGSDAAITITTASNQLKGPILVIPFGTSVTGLAQQIGVVTSIKAALGELPQKLTFAVQNNCLALNPAASQSVQVVPIWNTVTT